MLDGPHIPQGPDEELRTGQRARGALRVLLIVLATLASTFDPSAQSFTPIRINAGGQAFTTNQGQLWLADTLFSGGSTNAVTTRIRGTPNDALYQTERIGNFSYNVPVPNGSYSIALHFAEIGGNSAGQRIFDVTIEGGLVIDNLDIVSQVGANAALVLTRPATVTDGVLNIVFTTVVNNATLAALEVTGIPNQPPVVSAGADQTITLPASATLSGSVKDDGLPNPPATVTTTWSMVSGPGSVKFGNPNALSTTASFSQAGSYTLRLTASDSALTTFDDVVITVNPVGNQPPVVSAGADQTITLPASATVSGTATDDGLPNPPATLTTTWSMVSGPGSVKFGNPNALSTTASFSQAGSYTLRLTASDSALTTFDDVVITVNPTGGSFTPIRINAGGPSVFDGSNNEWVADTLFSGGTTFTSTVPINGVTFDALYQSARVGTFSYNVPVPNGSYEVSLYFAELLHTQAGARVFDITIEGVLVEDNLDIFGRVGQNTALAFPHTVSVNDGALTLVFTPSVGEALLAGLRATAVTVANQPPVANAGPDQTITLPSTAVTSGQATDDGLPNPPATLTTTWSMISGPGSVQFGNPNALSTTASFSTAGSYTLRLTASDSVLSAFDDVVITVNPSGGSFTPIRINAGGAAFTDNLGQQWQADTQFSGGTVYSVTTPIAGTTNDPLYQTERYGNFSYNLPVPNGGYTVALHFAELFWTSAGQRIFDVTIEGALAIDNLDIVSQVGANTALLLTRSATVSDGVLTIAFTTVVNNAKLSALQVTAAGGGTNQPPVVSAGVDQTITLPASATVSGTATDDALPNPPAMLTTTWSMVSGPGSVQFGNPNALSTTASFNQAGSYTLRLTASDSALTAFDDVVITVNPAGGSFTPIRINAGGAAFTDNLGQEWQADTQFSGGETFAVTTPIAGTANDPLYQTERYDNFSYNLAVPNGTYELVLHFAEIFWTAPGERIFDVTIEGALALVNFDIAAQVGANTSLTKSVSATVNDGVLTLDFTAVVNYAKLSALEVLSHPGHPFLHVVIDAPPFVVDYDGNGSEVVHLVGEKSHTHQIGHQLVGWTWTSGSAVVGTGENIDATMALGNHSVTLTIEDDNSPPETLSSSVQLPIYPINAVGGLIARYYPSGATPPAQLIDTLPAQPGFMEVRPSTSVTAIGGNIGGSPFQSNVIVTLQGNFAVPSAANYQFLMAGGTATRLFVNGAPVSGPIALSAGSHAIEARFAVNGVGDLPLEVLASINGGAAAPLTASSLSHDQTNLPPFINSITPSGAPAGGTPVTIKGIGFFPSQSVVVQWGGQSLPGAAVNVTPDSITFLSPPGTGTVAVAVATPNGTSNSVAFTYIQGSAPIVFNLASASGSGYIAPVQPTQGAWGPDGRLYVGSLTGQIFIYTFNDNYQVTATQVVGTLQSASNPHILGIAFSPFDASSPVKIYVAHSTLFANGGACFNEPSPYSGQVSVLTGPNFNTVTPVLTGLPVSNHDHGINGLEFDHNGDLLVAVGGNTNAGVAGNCNIGQLPESPFSAAILRARLSKAGSFNGAVTYVGAPAPASNNLDQRFGEVVSVVPGVDVEVFAAGFRNPFDLVLTTKGRLYATDNGPNVDFGPASTGPNTQGPDPYDLDELVLVELGDYYGHPNRSRGRDDVRQTVYHGNSEAADPSAFIQGLALFDPSTNGIVEYRAQTFGGAMRGNLLTQQWDGQTYRLTLAPDGRLITNFTTLDTTLGSLDIITAPGGALIGVDYSGEQLVIATPNDAAASGLTVYDIHPWRAPAAGGRPFVIGGASFGNSFGAVSVTIGGTAATLTSVAPTRIRGIIPAKSGATPDLLDIVVTVSGQSVTLTQAFRYLVPPGQEDSGAAATLVVDPGGTIVDSSTFSSGSFVISNESTRGQTIDRLRIDLRGAVLPDLPFDPAGTAGDTLAKPFTADSSTAEVGLIDAVHPAPYQNGFNMLDVRFSDFDPGDSFSFSIDIDPSTIQGVGAPGPHDAGSVSGLEITGARVSVYFSDGTMRSGNLFRIPNSFTGSEAVFSAGQSDAPAIQALGTSTPTTVSNSAQTIRVSGPAGATIALLQVEGGRFTSGVPGGGFDIDPFEANTILQVQEHTATIGGSGFVDVPVTLMRTIDSSGVTGINVFTAVIKDGSGHAGRTSPTVILQLVP